MHKRIPHFFRKARRKRFDEGKPNIPLTLFRVIFKGRKESHYLLKYNKANQWNNASALKN